MATSTAPGIAKPSRGATICEVQGDEIVWFDHGAGGAAGANAR
jgi:hypothetical protein